MKATVGYAHQHNVAVIMSNHDFHKTPAAEEIVQRLRKMQELGRRYSEDRRHAAD